MKLQPEAKTASLKDFLNIQVFSLSYEILLVVISIHMRKEKLQNSLNSDLLLKDPRWTQKNTKSTK